MMFFKKKKEKDNVCKNYENGMCSLVFELQELTNREKELKEKLEKENNIHTLPLDNFWQFWSNRYLGLLRSRDGWDMNAPPACSDSNLELISSALKELPDFNAFIDEWGLLYETIMGHQNINKELAKIRARKLVIKDELGIK